MLFCSHGWHFVPPKGMKHAKAYTSHCDKAYTCGKFGSDFMQFLKASWKGPSRKSLINSERSCQFQACKISRKFNHDHHSTKYLPLIFYWYPGSCGFSNGDSFDSPSYKMTRQTLSKVKLSWPSKTHDSWHQAGQKNVSTFRQILKSVAWLSANLIFENLDIK